MFQRVVDATTCLSMIWNLPKPSALTACETVKVSSGTTPDTAAVIWICAPTNRSSASCLGNIVAVMVSLSIFRIGYLGPVLFLICVMVSN